MLFPGSQKKRIDILGGLTSLIFTLAIAGIFGLLIYAIADGYLEIKVDKVIDPMARAHELLNAVYAIIVVALGIMCLEKMRSTLTRSSDTPTSVSSAPARSLRSPPTALPFLPSPARK